MIEERAPGLRRIRAPNPSPLTGSGTNSYLVGRGRSLALIDPGPDLDTHKQALLRAPAPGQQITHILVTHPHRDHSALAHEIARETGARVLAFGTALDGLSPRMQALAQDGTLVSGEGSDHTFHPDARLAHGDRIEADGWQVEALHTPGHMGSHLCFAWGDILFSGDHVMGWSTSLVAPPEGDMAAYMASLARLADRRWTAFFPGHGDPVTDPAARLASLAEHRRGREAAILQALQASPTPIEAPGARGPHPPQDGHSVSEIARRVYTTTPAHLLPAAERNVLAHLIDLVDRGQATSRGPIGPNARFFLTRP